VLATGLKVRWFKPVRGEVAYFKGDTNPQHDFLGRASKTVGSMYHFMTSKNAIMNYEQRYFKGQIHHSL
jgi:hypothetical protein